MKQIVSFLFLTFCLLILSPISFAQTPKPARADMMAARKDMRIARLDTSRLNVCKTKEKVITNRLDSLIKLVGTQETVFDKIAARVETFYSEKVLSAGKTVSNYDSLVADIAAKKSAVDTSLATAKTNAGNFSCTADNPKGDLTQFRTDIQAVKSALKDYRTSIRNLIVAIKSVVPEESPTPTPTP